MSFWRKLGKVLAVVAAVAAVVFTAGGGLALLPGFVAAGGAGTIGGTIVAGLYGAAAGAVVGGLWAGNTKGMKKGAMLGGLIGGAAGYGLLGAQASGASGLPGYTGPMAGKVLGTGANVQATGQAASSALQANTLTPAIANQAAASTTANAAGQAALAATPGGQAAAAAAAKAAAAQTATMAGGAGGVAAGGVTGAAPLTQAQIMKSTGKYMLYAEGVKLLAGGVGGMMEAKDEEEIRKRSEERFGYHVPYQSVVPTPMGAATSRVRASDGLIG